VIFHEDKQQIAHRAEMRRRRMPALPYPLRINGPRFEKSMRIKYRLNACPFPHHTPAMNTQKGVLFVMKHVITATIAIALASAAAVTESFPDPLLTTPT
jgi:hypothetical protein